MSVCSRAHTCTHKDITLIIISSLSRSDGIWFSTAHLFAHLLINTSRQRHGNWTFARRCVHVTECVCVCVRTHMWGCLEFFSVSPECHSVCFYLCDSSLTCWSQNYFWGHGRVVAEWSDRIKRGLFHLCRCHINASGWGWCKCVCLYVCHPADSRCVLRIERAGSQVIAHSRSCQCLVFLRVKITRFRTRFNTCKNVKSGLINL